jgi:putative membrane protein
MADQNKPNKDLILREKLALQRTVLANQTTFLSFLRTSMYFLMAGLSLRNIFKVSDYMLFEILFYVISVTVLLIGIFNYFKHKGFIVASEIHVGNYKDEYLQS